MAGVPVGTCLSSGTARSVSPPRPGDLVITEIMADPKAVPDTAGEWVEVYALRDMDLNGVALANEGSGRATVEDSKCLSLRAGAYGVLARSGDSSTNGGLPPVVGTFSFGLGNGPEPHALRLLLGETLLDEVAWASAATPGVSRQLDPSREDASRNDAPEAFCPTPEGVSYNAVDRAPWSGEPSMRPVSGWRVCTVLLGLVLIVLCACGSEPACGPGAGVVSRVVDGDTVVLQSGERVRYLLVDTPETTNGKHECFGAEARDFNRSLVEGRNVRLEYGEACTDRYGRETAGVRDGGRARGEFAARRGRVRVRALRGPCGRLEALGVRGARVLGPAGGTRDVERLLPA